MANETEKEYKLLLKSIVDSSDDAIISQSLDGVDRTTISSQVKPSF